MYIDQLFQEFAKSRNILLDYSSNCEKIKVKNDQEELLQVFYNFLSNSLSFSRVGNISVKVSVDYRDINTFPLSNHHIHSERFHLKVTVKENNTDLAPNNLSKAFYSFCQSEHPRIIRVMLNIGSSLTKGIIDLNGGTINVENRETIKDTPGFTKFILLLLSRNAYVNKDVCVEDPDSPPQNFYNNTATKNLEWKGLNEGQDKGSVTREMPIMRYDETKNPDDEFLCKLMTLLESNISDPEFNVSKLANEIGMSRPVLFRKTKTLTGSSIINLIRSKRLKKAEILLKQKKIAFPEVAFKVGYNDPKYFSKSFRCEFGKTPREYVHDLG